MDTTIGIAGLILIVVVVTIAWWINKKNDPEMDDDEFHESMFEILKASKAPSVAPVSPTPKRKEVPSPPFAIFFLPQIRYLPYPRAGNEEIGGAGETAQGIGCGFEQSQSDHCFHCRPRRRREIRPHERVWCWHSAHSGYDGADRVFAWSFGGRESHVAASGSTRFFESALLFFGHKGPLPGMDEEKAKSLAKLLRSQRGILILDGIETLQHKPGIQRGRLVDAGIGIFLHLIAKKGLPEGGLVSVSSRQSIVELENTRGEDTGKWDWDHSAAKKERNS